MNESASRFLFELEVAKFPGRMLVSRSWELLASSFPTIELTFKDKRRNDNVEVRSTLVRVLSTCYDVSIADDGETALWRFEQGQRFDVVLCDVFMPRMDAALLVDHLRRLDADQARRVIVLTSNADSPLAARLSDHYVVEKPFNLGELRELIDRVSAAARDGYFPSRVANRTWR